jgi:hypothetical protein
MSRIYSAIITGLLAGLAIGISSLILEALKVENKIVLAIIFSIAVYIILGIFEKYKMNKLKSTNVP